MCATASNHRVRVWNCDKLYTTYSAIQYNRSVYDTFYKFYVAYAGSMAASESQVGWWLFQQATCTPVVGAVGTSLGAEAGVLASLACENGITAVGRYIGVPG